MKSLYLRLKSLIPSATATKKLVKSLFRLPVETSEKSKLIT